MGGGKKFGINTKSAEARERKALQDLAKSKEVAKKKEELEAKCWDQGAYHNPKKEAEESKRLEKLQKKKERELLLEKEEQGFDKPNSPSTYSLVKTNTKTASINNEPTIKTSDYIDEEIPEYYASNIDDALALLEVTTFSNDKCPNSAVLEKHPERRMEAAYNKFEQIQLPLLKQQYPGLRHSQLKERLYRLWKKSPDNPMNKPHITYKASREEELTAIKVQNEAKLEQFRLNK